jgi:hypothetical protein
MMSQPYQAITFLVEDLDRENRVTETVFHCTQDAIADIEPVLRHQEIGRVPGVWVAPEIVAYDVTIRFRVVRSPDHDPDSVLYTVKEIDRDARDRD